MLVSVFYPIKSTTITNNSKQISTNVSIILVQLQHLV